MSVHLDKLAQIKGHYPIALRRLYKIGTSLLARLVSLLPVRGILSLLW